MITISVIILLLLAVLGALLSYRDLQLLQTGIRCLVRAESAPARLALTTRLARSIWRTVLLLATKRTELEQTKEQFHQVLSIGSRVAAVADEEGHGAEMVLSLLFEQLSDALRAAAVFVIAPDGTTRMLREQGLTGSRMRESAQLAVEAASAVEVPTFSNAVADDSANLAVFGIASSALFPFGSRELRGLLWLGFSRADVVLSRGERQHIEALAHQAAASLTTAAQAQGRVARSDKERDFLLGLSHDMRAPGTRALCAVQELLLENSLEQSVQQRLRVVERSINQQLTLLTDVLEFAKHRRGFLHASRVAIPLDRALGPLLSDVQAEANAKGLALEIGPLPEVSIVVDVQQFRRMVSNLVGNAIKYTDSGSISVVCICEQNVLLLEVLDTGIGVIESEREVLFSEFRRPDSARDGVGLGLALTKALAELNGGYVYYRPRTFVGSVFGVAVPRVAGMYSTGSPLLRRLVVIEDDPLQLRMLVRWLDGLAEQLVFAATCHDARQVLLEDIPDLVISDLRLGDGEVQSVLSEIPVTVPVVLVSGSSRVPLRPNYSILQKPVDRELLLAHIAATTAKRAA